MKVGAVVILSKDKKVEESFLELKAMGMESCQIVCWDRDILHDDNAAAEINEGVAKHGIHVTAFWCGWEGRKVWDFYDGQLTLGLVPADYRYERVKMLLEGVEFARKIHVKDMATHVGYMPENPYDANYPAVLNAVKEVVIKCKEYDMNFLFETGQETPVTLKRAIQDIEKDLGKGNVGINLDPANLILYGKANPVDALEVFGEYVRGVHGKDGKYPTDGHALGEETAIGQGKVNYPAFIAKLKEVGYKGDITIEREITGEQQKEDIRMGKELLESLI